MKFLSGKDLSSSIKYTDKKQVWKRYFLDLEIGGFIGCFISDFIILITGIHDVDAFMNSLRGSFQAFLILSCLVYVFTKKCLNKIIDKEVSDAEKNICEISEKIKEYGLNVDTSSLKTAQVEQKRKVDIKAVEVLLNLKDLKVKKVSTQVIKIKTLEDEIKYLVQIKAQVKAQAFDELIKTRHDLDFVYLDDDNENLEEDINVKKLAR